MEYLKTKEKLKIKLPEKMPQVSIITVVMNEVDRIERTILSVLNQTYKNIEYIIIDGGSIDGTLEIIKKYQAKISLIVSEPDKGIYDAMNKGIKLAHGTVIGILNGDDYYYQDAVEKVILFYNKNNIFDIIHGNTTSVNLRNEIIVNKPGELKKLSRSMVLNHPACFIKNTVYEKRMYDINYRISADYDFLLWCYIQKMEFGYLDAELTFFSTDGISSNNIEIKDSLKIIRNYYGLFKASTALIYIIPLLFINAIPKPIAIILSKIKVQLHQIKLFQ